MKLIKIFRIDNKDTKDTTNWTTRVANMWHAAVYVYKLMSMASTQVSHRVEFFSQLCCCEISTFHRKFYFVCLWNNWFILHFIICLSAYLPAYLYDLILLREHAIHLYVYFFFCFSINSCLIFLCRKTQLSIYNLHFLSVWLSVRLSSRPSVRSSVHLSFCPSVFLPVFLSICLSVCLYICLFVSLTNHLIYLSVCSSVHLSLCMSVSMR